ncbi:MAG: PEP-CTERM sorting domain-containing protein [Verrucomicrobiia bacterium]
MRKIFVARIMRLALVSGAMAVASIASANTVVVDANNTSPGDDFTNAGAVTTTPAAPGAALDASGWYYNNVRNNGHVGISTANPFDGDGSVGFNATQGGGSSSKADIEYYNIVGGVPQSLGTLGNLTSFSYDWYRNSGGTASQWLTPVLRLYVESPDLTKSGYLVFEPVYNALGNNAAPVNQWETDNIVTEDAHLWSSGSTLPNLGNDYGDAVKLSSWKANYGNYLVLGVSAGVGSGWDTLQGAVDDITVGFSGAATTYNFEVVPEPTTLALLGFGLAGLVLIRKRK